MILYPVGSSGLPFWTVLSSLFLSSSPLMLPRPAASMVLRLPGGAAALVARRQLLLPPARPSLWALSMVQNRGLEVRREGATPTGETNLVGFTGCACANSRARLFVALFGILVGCSLFSLDAFILQRVA